jgi:hypothetical protein
MENALNKLFSILTIFLLSKTFSSSDALNITKIYDEQEVTFKSLFNLILKTIGLSKKE